MTRTTTKERMGADITSAGFSSDVYCYQIDYYMRDTVTQSAMGKAKYRTQGVVQLDTGITQNSTALVAVVKEDGYTVKLTGKTASLSKIELWQDGKYVNTVPITIDPESKQLIINLSTYPSGSYQLKPSYSLTGTQLRQRAWVRAEAPSIAAEDPELTLPFIIYSAIASPTPLMKGIDCGVHIKTLDSHGQVVWEVPLPFRAAPIKITCEYVDADEQIHIQQDEIVPGTDKGRYTDDDGNVLICNTEFEYKPAKINHLQLSIKIGEQWIGLVNEDPYVPPPPSLRQMVSPSDQQLFVVNPKQLTPERTWQLHKVRHIQQSIAKQKAAQKKGQKGQVALMCIPYVRAEKNLIQESIFLPTTTSLLTLVNGLPATGTYALIYLDFAMDRLAKWKSLTIKLIDFNAGLLVIDTTEVVTGIYPYKLARITDSGKEIIAEGTFTLNRGALVFSNDPLPPIVPISAAPQHYTEYDAWDQEQKLTNSLGNTTDKTHSLLGQLLATTAPVVTVTDEHGKKQDIRPVTTYAYNKRGVQIGVRDANGGVTASLVNAAGQTLQTILADGTRQYTFGHDCFGQ